MPNDIKVLPEIEEAKLQDAKNELNESKMIDIAIDKLRASKRKTVSQMMDESHKLVAEKSIYSYAQRSAKQLFTMMQTISNTRRNTDTSKKIDAVLENQKILASLIIQLKLNNRQINEMAQSK